MKTYVIKRLLWMLPVLIGISLVTFVVMHLAPGGPVELMTSMSPKIDASARAHLAELYGLNQPILVQYGKWFIRMFSFDFGNSFKDGVPVISKIARCLPATLLLQLLSLGLIWTLAVPIGVTSAARHGSFYDRMLTLFVFIGYATPTFWLALLLMILFGVRLGWLPVSGLTSVNFALLGFWGKVGDVLSHLILPVVVSAFGGLAGLSRYTKSSTLEVLHQDFIRTARAKGVPEKQILWKHAWRNAMIPAVTILGLSLPSLIGGSFIFETIFAWPGMGRLGYQAIMSRDYPVLMGVAVIAAFLTLLGNLLADISYAWVDPRVRYSKK